MKESTSDEFVLIAYGGNLSIGEYQNYEFTVTIKFIMTKRLSNGAMWIDVNQDNVLALEKELEKEGIFFELR